MRVIGIAVLCAVICSASAFAYTGGPIHVEIAGIEPVEAKVFYRVHNFDESGDTPQVWYFDLKGKEPTRPIRARSLEIRMRGATVAWGTHVSRLQRLRGLQSYELQLAVSAESVGFHKNWNAARYKLTATVSRPNVSRTLSFDAHCEPLVRVQGVYLIPGRSEELIVLSRIGRAYGCEEIEVPVLLVQGE